ncbi:MAG: ubiquinone/menaquinone biosynthesis C-methylase UbiE [Arenicella sp.]|jgi:ubiquinone/menaquinone biosynthesis C-methylase UbiE
MKNEIKHLAWTIYWAEDHLQSFVATDGDADKHVLNSIWQEFARSLDDGAKVLDLATGNGAVPVALLSAREQLQIDAVDQAAIDPIQFVKGVIELEAVNFHSDIDVNTLPFTSDSFDAITSQFGIEYAGLSEATAKALEVLKKNGRMSFLIHHADSAIIDSSRVKLREMEQLLKEGGLIEMVLQVLRGTIEFSELESQGAAYLDGDLVRTQAISGQVFTGIGEIANAMQTDMLRAVNLGASIKLRLSSEHERLKQMGNAAQSDADMIEYRKLLELNGMELSTMQAIYADQSDQKYLLAWLVQGQKTKA